MDRLLFGFIRAFLVQPLVGVWQVPNIDHVFATVNVRRVNFATDAIMIIEMNDVMPEGWREISFTPADKQWIFDTMPANNYIVSEVPCVISNSKIDVFSYKIDQDFLMILADIGVNEIDLEDPQSDLFFILRSNGATIAGRDDIFESIDDSKQKIIDGIISDLDGSTYTTIASV